MSDERLLMGNYGDPPVTFVRGSGWPGWERAMLIVIILVSTVEHGRQMGIMFLSGGGVVSRRRRFFAIRIPPLLHHSSRRIKRLRAVRL